MTNNAFPCNGYITAWNFQREFPGETVFIGVFRQSSSTDFSLIEATEIPRLTKDRFELAKPILVKKGDFIGIFNREGDRGGNLAFTTEAGPGVLDYELYQGYRLKMYAKDIMTGAPFKIADFENTETKVLFAVQADMSYLNVPGKINKQTLYLDTLSISIARDFGFFHVKKQSSSLIECYQFYFSDSL
jgi:hypothetical protein